MALNKTPQQQALTQAMLYQQSKQKVHAANVARSNVPGQSALELEPFKLKLKKSTGGATTLKRTSAHHLSPTNVSEAGGEVKYKSKSKRDKNLERSITGNTIQAEQELLRLNESLTENYGLQQAQKAMYARLKAAYSFGGR